MAENLLPSWINVIDESMSKWVNEIYLPRLYVYVMQIMSMYGTMSELGEEKKRHVMVNGVQQVHTFKYPEVVHNHYRYQDMINNHNSLQMHPLSMEEMWMTACWPHCVFGFLLTMTLVNIQNGGVYVFLCNSKTGSPSLLESSYTTDI